MKLVLTHNDSSLPPVFFQLKLNIDPMISTLPEDDSYIMYDHVEAYFPIYYFAERRVSYGSPSLQKMTQMTGYNKRGLLKSPARSLTNLFSRMANLPFWERAVGYLDTNDNDQVSKCDPLA